MIEVLQMKKNIKKALFIFTCLLAGLVLTACASKNKPPRERDEFFIADISPMELDTIHLYASFGLSKPKISDFTVSFYPRTNVVYLKSRVGMDVIMIGFNYQARKDFAQARDMYLEAYKSGKIKREKPTKKNAFTKGYLPFGWGALSAGYHATVDYFTNVEYVMEKPYFLLRLEATRGLGEDSNVSSPRTNIYISPAQWEQITQLCNQARLEELADQVLDEANKFDYDPSFSSSTEEVEEVEAAEEVTEVEIF